MNRLLLQEAIRYFKEDNGFERLFRKMIERYISLGRIGGTVTLQKLTDEEKEALSTFFGKDFSRQKSATIQLQKMEEQLKTTRFSSLTLLEVLEGYAGHSIKTRAEVEEKVRQQKEAFFTHMKDRCEENLVKKWTEHITERGKGARVIHHALDKGEEETAFLLMAVLQDSLSEVIIKRKERKYERLPLFAQRLTGDPHAFDSNRELGAALLSALQWLKREIEHEYDVSEKLTTEKTNDLLQFFYIYRDDIANFVTCIGLHGMREGKEAGVFAAACNEKTVLNVPLREVLKLTKVEPAWQGKVLVVENSGVFSELVAQMNETNRWQPLICLHGQPKLAGLLLLDRLNESGAHLFYAGDWDPEGLLMAERLLERFPKMTTIWHENSQLYNDSSGVVLSNERLKKLDNVHHPSLQTAKQQIQEKKIAFYQEQYVSSLFS